ncbi:2634_t:CDS:1, partial [Cetraspora pellucida]
EPVKLEAHLALQCPNVEKHVRQFYLFCVTCCDNLEEQFEYSKKQKSNNQHNLTKYFSQKTGDGLSEKQINIINITLLKDFVMCGISFSIIENLYFIDLLQTLCSDYDTPSRKILAG